MPKLLLPELLLPELLLLELLLPKLLRPETGELKGAEGNCSDENHLED